MTSNLGAQNLMEGVRDDGEIQEFARDQVMTELRHTFRPEFLNRVDDIVLFKPLRLEEIRRIVELLTDDLRKRLADREIGLEIDEAATTWLAEKGFDPAYGARPLRRFMQRELETRIGRALIGGDIIPGTTILVGLRDGELHIDRRESLQTAE